MNEINVVDVGDAGVAPDSPAELRINIIDIPYTYCKINNTIIGSISLRLIFLNIKYHLPPSAYNVGISNTKQNSIDSTVSEIGTGIYNTTKKSIKPNISNPHFKGDKSGIPL